MLVLKEPQTTLSRSPGFSVQINGKLIITTVKAITDGNYKYKIMVTTFNQTVKQNILLSKREIQDLEMAVSEKARKVTDKFLYTALAMIDRCSWNACVAWGVVTKENPNEINHNRLRQMALGSSEDVVEFTMSMTWFGNVYLKKCWNGFAATSNKTWLAVRSWLCDKFFYEIDEEKKPHMVLNDEANPETGEFEEKCETGLGIFRIVQPKSQIVIGKDGNERPAGITILPTTYEHFNIGKALIVFRTIYRILEDRYNRKYKDNPSVSFYDQLPSHKCNFVRNLWNAFYPGGEDFEGNIYTEEHRDFTFQYPDNLVERVRKGFTLVWKESFKIAEEIWNKMERWGRAIPSWRKVNPYPEAEVREFEFVEVEF